MSLEQLLQNGSIAEALSGSGSEDEAMGILARNGIFLTEEELLSRLLPEYEDELDENALDCVAGGTGSAFMSLLRVYIDRVRM